MNILVTGAAGYVGSVCAAELVRQGNQVVAYDNLSAGHRQAVAGGARLVVGDIADTEKLERVCKRYGIEAVMHFAASALVEESVRNPNLFYSNNISGTIALLGVMASLKIRRLIFSSSAAVYGEPKIVPIPEDHPTSPVNPYGETKLVIERALAWYDHAYGIQSAALRYFNAAGATAEFGEDHRPETHLLPRLFTAASGSQAAFHIYGDDYPTPDGTCVRDYVHVLDIAQAHILALHSLSKLGSRIYNVGHGKGYSIRAVLKAVEEITGRKLEVQVSGRRPGDPAVLVATARRLRRELKWQPRHSDLKNIIESAWVWMQNHPKGYRA
jgi:UDP-glucose 4-epimerase